MNKNARALTFATVAGLAALPLSAPLLALDPTKPVTQYVHDVWQGKDGLPQSGASSIVQTLDGYIWFGTESGLVRFDGVRFTVFDRRNTPAFPSGIIRVVCGDRQGSLWVATAPEGLFRLKDGTFTRITKKDGLSNEVITGLREGRDGSLWIGTSGGGLNRLKDGRFTVYTTKNGLSSDVVRSFLEDREGGLWIGTRGGLNRLKDGRVTAYTTKDGLSHDVALAIVEDREGSLWIGTPKGLDRLKDGVFTTYTTRDGLTNDYVTALLEDRDGNLWVGTPEGGLSRFRDGRFSAVAMKDLSNTDVVKSLLEDREGSLWIGTDEGGLHRLRDGKFVAYTERDGMTASFVYSLLEDRDGGLWFGTQYGLNRLKDGEFTAFTAKDGLSHDVVTSLLQDREGSLWIGTAEGGLNRLKDGKFTSWTKKDGLAGPSVSALLQDREGSLWIGHPGAGLDRLKDGAFTAFTTKDGLSSNGIRSLVEGRDGSLWIGTNDGLSRLKSGKVTIYREKDGKLGNSIQSLVESRDGTLWIATGYGLKRLKDGRLTSLAVGEGPSDDDLMRILEDDQGYLWMASNRGVFRAARRELDAYAEGESTKVSWTHYDTDDGMPITDASCCGQLRSRGGRLWFPTTRGVAVVDPARIPTNTVPPPVVVEEVRLDGKVASRPRSGSSLAVPPGTQKLEIHYTALSFVAPRRVKFRYRLEGYDPGWVEAGTDRVAHYTNLAPRAYVFRVIACNDDGLWNETGASLAITLLPRFWQTWWFRGLEGLVGLGVFAGALLLQRRRLEAHKAVELRLADLDRKTGELEHARRVQLALLPKEPLTVGAWTVAGGMQTATEVGGDYYGYLEVGGRLCVVIGDATGHGMASGLVAGMLKSALAALSRRASRSEGPAAWLADLNGALRSSIAQRGLGVCLGIGLVDVETDEVELGMAGVPHPFHVTASGRVERLQLSGTPLGYLKKLLPATATRTLEPGDRLVLITDGLMEQVNAGGEEWGYAGVEAALAKLAESGAPDVSAGRIAEELLAACERYGAGQPRSDDRTVVVLARRAAETRGAG